MLCSKLISDAPSAFPQMSMQMDGTSEHGDSLILTFKDNEDGSYSEMELLILDTTLFVPVAYALLAACPRK